MRRIIKSIKPAITFDIMIGKDVQMIFNADVCPIFISKLKKLSLGVLQISIEFRCPGKLLLILQIPDNLGYFADCNLKAPYYPDDDQRE